MSAVRMEFQTSDYDAAQALLDLQGDIKPENLESRTWRGNDNNYKTDMDKAAKLFWNCYISSETPNNSNTNILHSHAINKTSTSTESNPMFYDNLNKTLTNKRIGSYKSTSEQSFDLRKNNSNIDRNTFKVNSKDKIRTRDIGTQTEERYFNPNIELMELTIQNLFERIKLLETQLKEPNVNVSAEQAACVSSEDGSNYGNEEILNASFDYDSNLNKTDRISESNTSHYSEYSQKSPFDRSDYNRKNNSKNSSYNHNRVLINHNAHKKTGDMVPIGDGHATVPSRVLKHINWNSYTSATRKLLTAVFSRRILATHSLTGKPSPAFPNKPAKKKLDPALVNDIVQTVVERCSVPENVVRTSITTKCADESKMFRTRQRNVKKKANKKDRENLLIFTSDSEFENY